MQDAFDSVETNFLAQEVEYTYEKQIDLVIDSNGNVEYDLAGPAIFNCVLTKDITSMSFINYPVSGLLAKTVTVFTQDANGGYSVNFGAVRFTNGSPIIGGNPGDSTIITLFSYTQGSDTLGVSAGVAYSA